MELILAGLDSPVLDILSEFPFSYDRTGVKHERRGSYDTEQALSIAESVLIEAFQKGANSARKSCRGKQLAGQA
jgi:hypothetical protein